MDEFPNNNMNSGYNNGGQPPSNGKAVTSLVLGILSLVFTFFGTYAFIGIILAIIGLVFGIQAKNENPSGIATAGFVLSIIGLALCSISFIACAACVGAASMMY